MSDKEQNPVRITSEGQLVEIYGVPVDFQMPKMPMWDFVYGPVRSLWAVRVKPEVKKNCEV